MPQMQFIWTNALYSNLTTQVEGTCLYIPPDQLRLAAVEHKRHDALQQVMHTYFACYHVATSLVSADTCLVSVDTLLSADICPGGRLCL